MRPAIIYSMCLWWALDQWIGPGGRGGYLVFRKSVHLPFGIPHVLHQDRDGVIRHFVPNIKPRWALSTLFGFEGHVETGDPHLPEQQPGPWTVVIGSMLLLSIAVPWAVSRMLLGAFRFLRKE